MARQPPLGRYRPVGRRRPGDQGPSTNSPRDGLIGCYRVGNYGDDLMAFLCVVHLVAHGLPYLLGDTARDNLDSAAFPRLGTLLTRNPREFLQKVDVVIEGGGALLVSWHRRRFRRRFAAVAEKLLALVQLPRQRGLVAVV